MSFLKNLAVGVIGGLVVLAGSLLVPASSVKLGGGVGYDPIYQVGDIYQGLSQVLAFRDGVMTANVSSSALLVGGGTSIDLFKCTGATTWNPTAVATGTVVSATTSLSGAVLGDKTVAALATTTQGLDLFSYVSATGVVTYALSQPDTDGNPIDIATTTVDVCVIST